MGLRSSVIIVLALLAVFLFGKEMPLRPIAAASEEIPAVVKITIQNAAITPVTSRFILRSIAEAEERGARCIIIVLDTPGGLVESTRDIVKAILHSRIPVIVYVAPTGARAASAGVFITMAGHVAAMAPGTNIGAAHPVAIGGMPGQPSQPDEREKPAGESSNSNTKDNGKQRAKSPMEDKIVNDTVAWVRSLAELRGRNADWAESTVKESVSVTAAVAVEQNAVDLIAGDINDLLLKINGREVKLLQGTVLLETAGVGVVDIEMWWGEQVLAAIANPTIAFLLLIFGFYGILFEFYSPGWGVSGTVGIICLVLGFFAMAILPINYIGLALIFIALAMFVAEVFVVSYGFLTIGGAICLIFGGLMLIDSPDGVMQVPLWLLIPISMATAAVSFFLVGSIVKTHRNPSLTGADRMAGTIAIAIEPFQETGGNFIGRVTTHGEIWNAASKEPVEKGQEIVVESREGLSLRVRAGENSGEKNSDQEV